MKQNCWEHKNCNKGTECPAFIEERLNGIHDGKNAGRACWAVAGTLCGGTVQGQFAQKVNNCTKCDFYKLVKSEEGAGFESAKALLANMS